MTKAEVMKDLEANGSAQTRKIYGRHGVTGKMFGVSYAALGRLKRRIKTDQRLAEQLWATGNYDARVLATMIADPDTIRVGTLQAWARDLRDRHLAAAVSNLAAETPSAKKQLERWIAAKGEMIGCAGWHTLASVARQDNDLSDTYFEDHLKTIESRIHDSPNWVMYAMNNALISVGTRNRNLEKKAIAAAKRIGTVEIDHGETGCTTRDAAAYIKKTVAQRKKKARKKARGS